jgi:hypothetical protein
MPDSLYLNLWFSSFRKAEMLQRLSCVLHQFPFSAARPGIGYVAVHSIDWNEPLLFEQTFDYRAAPEPAIALASDFLHEDSAYIFEAMWDLWTHDPKTDQWIRQPHAVKFIAHGERFENGIALESGHIQLDLGLDSNFLLEDVALTQEAEERVRQNIEQLVKFTGALEKSCNLSSRLLWSESEENLAQKLVARLQRVQ